MSSVAPLDNDNYRTTISTRSGRSLVARLDKDNYATTISTLWIILILWGLLESIYIIVIFIYDFKNFTNQKQHFLNQLVCVHRLLQQ